MIYFLIFYLIYSFKKGQIFFNLAFIKFISFVSATFLFFFFFFLCCFFIFFVGGGWGWGVGFGKDVFKLQIDQLNDWIQLIGRVQTLGCS